MDYVELALRRQGALWGFLLEGREAPQEVQAQQRKREERRAALETWEERQLRWETPAQLPAADDEPTRRAREKTRQGQGGDALAAEERFGAGEGDGRRTQSEMATLAQALEQRSAAMERFVRERGETADGAAGEVLFGRRVASHAPEERRQVLPQRQEERAAPEDNGADAVSRLLERDARRYDSGFSLY